MLSVENLKIVYGNIPALREVSLEIEDEELVTIIGPNGAGKSTLINSIDGLKKPVTGRIFFRGNDIIDRRPWERLEMGIALVPEGGRVLPEFTVKENLDLGAYKRENESKISRSRDEVFDLFPVLQERINQSASTLSGGEQQMLSIGRAIMTDPNLLLVDEVSMGLMPKLVKQIFRTISNLNGEGMSILLADQNAEKALEIVDRGYILENGKITMGGKSSKLRNSEEVQRAYLGI